MSSPTEDLEVLVGVGDTLPDTLVLSLHSHGKGDNDPSSIQVHRRGAIIGDVAQDEDLNGIVWQTCTSKSQ